MSEKYIVKWQHRGEHEKKGQEFGKPMEKEKALTLVKRFNEQYPDFLHWSEKVNK